MINGFIRLHLEADSQAVEHFDLFFCVKQMGRNSLAATGVFLPRIFG